MKKFRVHYRQEDTRRWVMYTYSALGVFLLIELVAVFLL